MNEYRADQSQLYPLGITINRETGVPLLSQTVQALREAIRSRRIAGGTRLPPSRELSVDLGISRSVVVEAYEQLEAEGYLEGRVGAGTYVVELGVDAPAGDRAARQGSRAARAGARSIAGATAPASASAIIDFDAASGSAELSSFPRDEWARCLGLAARGPSAGYGYGEIAGRRELRAAIAEYLFRMKGLSCAEDEIIVTSGASQAAAILGPLLKSRSPLLQVEDPTYPPLRAALKRQGLALRPIAVDGEGLPPDGLEPGASLLATPAHHFPTGARLPAERREAIAAAARAGGSLIIEDDYDGELRLSGLPITPLRAIEPDRVILMGSLSKVMYPGLRVGYLCAPPGLVEKLLSIKSSLALWTDGLAQAALARFIDEGRLDRRIRRLKRGCRLKRELVEELAKGLPIEASATGEACGMHCALAFPGGLPARFDKRSTLGSGFAASPLSSLSILPRTARGGREAKGGQGSALLIGYGSLGEEEIRLGFSRIAAYLPR